MTRSSEPFVVMAKPVGSLCNLECAYCYYLKTELGETTSRYRMTDELLETFIRQYILSSPGPVVSFTWHGGEPTLAGLDFYRRAVDLQKKYLPEGWRCWNNLQTNGVLLDDEWCVFLKENNFDVGLSLDGTALLHDTYRKDHSGAGSYERAVSAVRRLQKHGVQPDLLCTVTSDTSKDPPGVYKALRDLNTGWMQFIPIVRRDTAGLVTPDSVTGEGYGQFLCDVFDGWLYNDLGRVTVQLFAETAMVLSGGAASLCWMAPECGRVLIAEHDGGVYSCDHFVTPEHRLGEIQTASPGTLADLPVQRSFGSVKQASLPTQCRGCPWLALCNGGCPKDRFILDENGEPGLNHLCAGLKKFFAHAEKPLRQVIELTREGLAPEAIRVRLRDEALARWKNVGRNDPCPCLSMKKAKHCCWEKRP